MSENGFKMCVLGSGSTGNATYVEYDGFGMLVDAGLSALATKQRMTSLGLSPARLRAICVTHEHGDHTKGIPQLRKQFGVDLFANLDTARAIDPELPWYIFQDGSPFQVGPFAVTPFSLPHDAIDPVGYVIAAGGISVGVATDMGMPTTLARERLSHCRALVLEANHEPSLLRASSRPQRLIQRILSRQGHLSNDTAAELAAELAAANPALEHVYAAHLSRSCNRLELAIDAFTRALAGAARADVAVHATFPDRASDVVEVEGLKG
ncbi:MAG: MBL fold metallo-hydrolase [Kiritimatiellae bacterium]|nr:MBL fold metallo-hydrolase [Kiritimatiellia bacterium]